MTPCPRTYTPPATARIDWHASTLALETAEGVFGVGADSMWLNLWFNVCILVGSSFDDCAESGRLRWQTAFAGMSLP